MLTELQKYRILYHLDISYSTAYAEVTAEFKLQLDGLQPAKELALIGNFETADPERIFEFQGTPICTIDSILGNCERALANISPTVVDVSLFVATTPEIKLRSNELANRWELYYSQVDLMCRLFDIDPPNRTSGLSYNW